MKSNQNHDLLLLTAYLIRGVCVCVCVTHSPSGVVVVARKCVSVSKQHFPHASKEVFLVFGMQGKVVVPGGDEYEDEPLSGSSSSSWES